MRDVLIDQLPLWPGETLRVTHRPYRGQSYIDVRRWRCEDGVWRPGRGLAVRRHTLPWLLRALETASECVPDDVARWVQR